MPVGDKGPGGAAGVPLENLSETKGLSGLRYFPAEVKSVENAEKQVSLNNV